MASEPKVCLCSDVPDSDGSASAEDNPACPIHGWGHWLAVEFELRKVLDHDEASTAALALKEAGFEVVAPDGKFTAALEQEAQRDEGSVECWNCGAVTHWEAEPPTDCLKCGEAL